MAPIAPLRRRRRLRFLPLGVGVLALIAGLWTGLARIGLQLPGGTPQLAEVHGALMICGFFGTLISLERAVAIGRPWAYGAPALGALAALALIAGATWPAGILFLAASAALTIVSAVAVKRHPALDTVVLTVAAACWTVGVARWLNGFPFADASGWWLTFLVLTIAAERLELSRVLNPPRSAKLLFGVAVALVLAGAAGAGLDGRFAPLLGAGFIACTAWLLRYDLARRTVHHAGQYRFSAICMLAGYGWLGVAGALLLASPWEPGPFVYDAAVHAIAIGFVLSMVFGHALIILPAVTGWQLRYSSIAYGPLALLHASVALRIGADLTGAAEPRTMSGLLTIFALVAYAVTLMVVSRTAPRAANQPVQS